MPNDECRNAGEVAALPVFVPDNTDFAIRAQRRMSRLVFFKNIQSECKEKVSYHGSQSYWGYFVDNLQYLIDLIEGRVIDRGRLAKISIGGVAVREIVGEDEIVERLCAVDEEIRKMIAESCENRAHQL